MEVERKILSMLLEGQIDLEKALSFLEALKPKEKKQGFFSRKAKKVVQTVYIQVEDPELEESFDLKVPVSLLKAGLKLVAKEIEDFALDEAMLEELMQAISDGRDGLILDVKSSEGLDIEVYIL